MKQEIIDFMKTQLFDNRWCKNDFEKYDLKRLECEDKEFLWQVGSEGTSLVFVGSSEIYQWYEKESMRMAIFRDFYAPISYALDVNHPDAKTYYYDGNRIWEAGASQIMTIYRDHYWKYHRQMIAKHFTDYLVKDAPLEIRFMGNTEETVKEALEYAASLDDTSLWECLERLSKYTRQAVNHYVEIYDDFTKYGFTFAEMINGKTRLVGGIIMHDLPGNRWSIHT